MDTKSNIRVSQSGNPTVLLPEAVFENGGRIFATRADGQLVWESFDLPSGGESVRIDVWDGRFVNSCEGCAILPTGECSVCMYGNGSEIIDVERIEIRERLLFEAMLDRSKDLWFSSDVDHSEYGNWESTSKGIRPLDGPAYLFADGAMHGVLCGQICIEEIDSKSSFGLVARFYNGFHHMRLDIMPRQSEIILSLLRFEGGDGQCQLKTEVANVCLSRSSKALHEIKWAFNGSRHEIYFDDDVAITAIDGYMGGVTIAGIFSTSPDMMWKRFSMSSTQSVPVFEVERPSYTASIRPGNIFKLCLNGLDRNIFWESGLQFGHIGGSEIKFTQAAILRQIHTGDMFTQVCWDGPMPKFVEQRNDIRGHAHGTATFYPWRIIVADFVTTFTNRSVGPDIDMWTEAIAGSTRIALAGERKFQDWALPSDGSMNMLPIDSCLGAFPVCVALPLRFGGGDWWLKVVIANLPHVKNENKTMIFGWQCPFGLTSSHDFRISPTEFGIEYGFSIILEWQKSTHAGPVEADLLELRDDWQQPMHIDARKGSCVKYSGDRDHPADAALLDGCFDRTAGLYRVLADNKRFAGQLDNIGLVRRNATMHIVDLGKGNLKCRLDGLELKSGLHYIEQQLADGSRVVTLIEPISNRVEIDISIK